MPFSSYARNLVHKKKASASNNALEPKSKPEDAPALLGVAPCFKEPMIGREDSSCNHGAIIVECGPARRQKSPEPRTEAVMKKTLFQWSKLLRLRIHTRILLHRNNPSAMINAAELKSNSSD